MVKKPEPKPRVYGDSELLLKLKNYTIEPSENIKRQIDYYYSPYNKNFNSEKFMKFDDSDRRNYQNVKGRMPEQFQNPISNRQLVADELWTKFKNKIFETERPILKGLQRHVHMTLNPTTDYLTKLDLIDTHPELFNMNNKTTFTEEEIEQLRVHIVGDK